MHFSLKKQISGKLHKYVKDNSKLFFLKKYMEVCTTKWWCLPQNTIEIELLKIIVKVRDKILFLLILITVQTDKTVSGISVISKMV